MIEGGRARVEKGREQKENGQGKGSRGAARFIGRPLLTQDHPVPCLPPLGLLSLTTTDCSVHIWLIWFDLFNLYLALIL